MPSTLCTELEENHITEPLQLYWEAGGVPQVTLQYRKWPVLVSPGIEMIFFFLISGSVLRFGFSMRTILIIKDFSVSHGLPASIRTRSWQEAQPGQITWNGERDIPNHRTLCPVHKLGADGQEGLITAWGKAQHLSVGGERLYHASLVFLMFIPLPLSSSLLWLFVDAVIIQFYLI